MKLPPILTVQQMDMIFPDSNGGLHAVKNISFEVCPQEFLCVVGPSGCGKSTLLRVLANLLNPTSGKVAFAGGEPRIGMVFQDSNLMPWRSALENITLPLELEGIDIDEAHARAQNLIDLVGLNGFEDNLPRDLSGGMAHRVALARSLVHDPDILLLDEPFASLDALTRERMGAELLRIWQTHQKTVIMVTHSISEALFLADRVLVLTQRPGSIKLDLEVDLPRPRTEEMLYTPKFGAMAKKLKEAIE
ncbi:MAG: ABC transporter ATP-binding protein [Anaerolineae bacterium]|jgi:NitT/TauT family transport system ATP-binding protein|nr:ABC transporter ATP-binding protein [Anaerolineae bacterium]MBT4309534.1 ABC transporter ATP-binding protein [Anaerolineae bacterium]MBT4458391.1 ABC transporter ATP-binding protein [Anaerolineae bacterium]MBT4841226.1 ABC transporter ATP-binding protein [Anaerolineae bacterium]MBT6060828.1 ABC transporter ATP-binding protein [Anaerolineae bacterium]